MHERMMKITK